MGAILDIATGWTLYAGLAAAIGGCAGRWYITPRSHPGSGSEKAILEAAAMRLALVGAVLLVPALGLFFLRQLLEFRDPFVPWTEDARLLLTGTAWGTRWLWGAALAVAAVVALAVAARGVVTARWLGLALVLALGAFPALTGHASGSDGPRALTLPADVLHVWAAGAWIGGLAFVLHAERRSRGATGETLLPRLVPAFSPLAVTSVAVLVLTGLAGAWVHLPSVSSLVDSPYGRTLSIKLLVVAAALALGFINWKRHTPRLGEPGGPDVLRRSATLELMVMQSVLLVTAVLVRSPPP